MRKIMFLLLVLVFLAGCGSVGQLVSKTEEFNITDQVKLEKPKPNILDAAMEVGRSMGFRISGIDRNGGSIVMVARSSTAEIIMVGSINASAIGVTTKDDGRIIEITVSVQGNYGKGDQKTAEELLKNFKEKLLEKLK